MTLPTVNHPVRRLAVGLFSADVDEGPMLDMLGELAILSFDESIELENPSCRK